MSEILAQNKLPLAIGAHVGVVFEVIRLGEADEQSNVTLRAVEPCPGSNFKPEISLHAQHCVMIGSAPAPLEQEEKHEETGGAGDDGGGKAEQIGAGEVAGLGTPPVSAPAPAANEVPAEGAGGAQATDTPPAA